MALVALDKRFRKETLDLILSRVRLGTPLGLVLFVVFSALDYLVYPQYYTEFLGVRMVTSFFIIMFLAASYTRWGRGHPQLLGLTMIYLAAAAIEYMVIRTGPAVSPYYAGLNVVLLFVSIMAPWEPRAFYRWLALLLSTYWIPAIAFGDWSIPTGYNNSFFLFGTAVLAAVFTHHNFQRHYKEFLSRRRLEDTAADLEDAQSRLLHIDQLKTRFFVNVSHELRTPLTLTLGPLESVLQGEFGEVDSRQLPYLKTMHSNALRLKRLINNLLDLTKLESGRLGLWLRRGDVVVFVKGLVAACRPVAERRGIRLTAEAGPVSAIYFDPDQLEKVLLNLIMNALKFTRPGGAVRVFVNEEEEFVHLGVEDTGVGIPVSELERVFDRFAQVDGSASRRYEGMGIGLALARELVELHGGRIWCESEEGHGTTMYVRLLKGEAHVPVEDREGRMASAGSRPFGDDLSAYEAEMDGGCLDGSGGEAEGAAAEVTSVMDLTVLVVEDSRDMRKLLADIVGRRYRVLEAADAEGALRLLGGEKVDLVLADVMMPGMSGYELCAAIKEDPETASVPVVLVTARAEFGMKMEGYAKGADDYIVKPFNSQELLARVGALLRVRALQRELQVRNEELESLSREVELYARAVSHDVRGPVAAAGEALRGLEGVTAERRGRRLKAVEGNIRRAERMLLGLRDLMRASGATEPVRRVDVGRLIDEVVGEVREHNGGGGVRIERVGMFGSVEGQAEKLGYVFRNLVGNAVRHAGNGTEGRVEIGGEEREERMLYWVRDNGSGIPYAYQRVVFEPFRCVPNGKGEGLGLGLALVHQIVTQHGGKVWVESSPGAGSTFWVALPAKMRNK